MPWIACMHQKSLRTNCHLPMLESLSSSAYEHLEIISGQNWVAMTFQLRHLYLAANLLDLWWHVLIHCYERTMETNSWESRLLLQFCYISIFFNNILQYFEANCIKRRSLVLLCIVSEYQIVFRQCTDYLSPFCLLSYFLLFLSIPD